MNHLTNNQSLSERLRPCLEHRNEKHRNRKKYRNRENIGIEKVKKPQELKTEETRFFGVWIAGNV
jgi:hypothetical protein